MSRASIEEGLKVAGIAAAISAVLSFATSLLNVLKGKNKKLSELTKDDWEEIFKETGIGAIKGGVSGGAIYALTNVAGMSAPLAASLVSATLGIATQAIRLYKKEISFDDFMYNIVDVATEAAVSGIGAFAGQMLIPVPGVGSIIGSLVATTVLNIVKKHLFGGGFYELVKAAHYEKEYSDEYKPLVVAFERCLQIILPKLQDTFEMLVTIEYSEEIDNAYVVIKYNGDTFNPESTDNELSMLLAKKATASISYCTEPEGELKNRVDAVIR